MSKYSNPVNLAILQKLATMQRSGDLSFVNPSSVNYDPEKLPRKNRRVAGFSLNIEFSAGDTRRGVDAEGNAWSRLMKVAYGEFASSYSVDGDPLDVYVGNDLNPKEVYVVHMAQKNNWDKYDEDKVMLGFSSLKEALDTFIDCYSGEVRFILAWSIYKVEDFRRQLPIKSNSKSVFTENPKLAQALLNSR